DDLENIPDLLVPNPQDEVASPAVAFLAEDEEIGLRASKGIGAEACLGQAISTFFSSGGCAQEGRREAREPFARVTLVDLKYPVQAQVGRVTDEGQDAVHGKKERLPAIRRAKLDLKAPRDAGNGLHHNPGKHSRVGWRLRRQLVQRFRQAGSLGKRVRGIEGQ